MRYLWDTPVQLDNAKLVSLLGAEPRTPLDDALRKALIALARCRRNREGFAPPSPDGTRVRP